MVWRAKVASRPFRRAARARHQAGMNHMDAALRVEPRKIEFTTYGTGMAPVWSVTFALHGGTGYEHRCTVIVPGQGHDDITEVCVRAREELIRICSLTAASTVPQQDEADKAPPPQPSGRPMRGRSRREA